ncbi:MAG: Crp/Fnr family transcriptional regulator [Bacteroidales bacterium]|nr:Crp/Fnr family transcriptional regulator [Bacteroidales bacterium]
MGNSLSEYLFNKDNDPNYLFGNLSEDQMAMLNSTSINKILKKGEKIFQEGSAPIGLIYLLRGSAKVFLVGTGEREQIVRLVKPLSFVGYKALFAEKMHTTNAIALEESEIIIYDKKVLDKIIELNTAFAKEIIKALASELAFNYNRIINLTQKHIRGRLAETLLLFRDHFGFEGDGKTLKARFTRDNIAHFSNMTTSNAIRTLKKFNTEKLIRSEGRRIMLINVPELEKISKLG